MSAEQTVRRLTGSGAPQYPEMPYAILQPLQGDYQGALKIFEAGILKVGEKTNPVSYLLALGAKALALMLSGQFGEALKVIRTAGERAEKNGNDPWLLNIREAWLRTIALDFEGAGRLCENMIRSNPGYPKGQPKTISRFATANAALAQGKYDEARQNFKQILDKEVTPKFFLHWYWRMQAQLGLGNAWLGSGHLLNARGEANRFLESALSTADPNLQALAWNLVARVAMAEKDWAGGERNIEKALAISEKFQIPTVAWRLHGTARDVYRQLKKIREAGKHRERAVECILALANSFEPDEPLRESFLAAIPVGRILSEKRSGHG
jgi:tetratricopeptide (TPR) repeat protein